MRGGEDLGGGLDVKRGGLMRCDEVAGLIKSEDVAGIESEDVAGVACGLGVRNSFNNPSCCSHILLISTRDSSGSTADAKADMVWNGDSLRCSCIRLWRSACVNGRAHSSSAFRLRGFPVEWPLTEDCIVLLTEGCDDGRGDDSVMWPRLLVAATGSCGDGKS